MYIPCVSFAASPYQWNNIHSHRMVCIASEHWVVQIEPRNVFLSFFLSLCIWQGFWSMFHMSTPYQQQLTRILGSNGIQNHPKTHKKRCLVCLSYTPERMIKIRMFIKLKYILKKTSWKTHYFSFLSRRSLYLICKLSIDVSICKLYNLIHHNATGSCRVYAHS